MKSWLLLVLRKEAQGSADSKLKRKRHPDVDTAKQASESQSANISSQRNDTPPGYLNYCNLIEFFSNVFPCLLNFYIMHTVFLIFILFPYYLYNNFHWKETIIIYYYYNSYFNYHDSFFSFLVTPKPQCNNSIQKKIYIYRKDCRW